MRRIPEPGTERPPYAQGFSSLGPEVRVDDLPVTGHFPAWLTGTLIRNGPGRFEVGTESFRHWFDGLAMLHKFSFRDGRVSYANRFLETHDFLEAAEQGRITRRAFATDPCRSIFGRSSRITLDCRPSACPAGSRKMACPLAFSSSGGHGTTGLCSASRSSSWLRANSPGNVRYPSWYSKPRSAIVRIVGFDFEPPYAVSTQFR
jgi:hypothetical protein